MGWNEETRTWHLAVLKIDKIAIILIIIAIFCDNRVELAKKTLTLSQTIYIKVKLMENKPLNRIKVMLAERMMSNKDLAERLGKDPATISKWVTNTTQPSLENLIEISRCLKCEINDLVRTTPIPEI